MRLQALTRGERARKIEAVDDGEAEGAGRQWRSGARSS
jgi:hypothetical protein